MRKAVKNKYPLVRIRWADHWIDNGDHDLEDIEDNVKNPYIGDYVGYLVAESQRMVCICSNVWDDGTLSDPMYIMKRAILERRVLDD